MAGNPTENDVIVEDTDKTSIFYSKTWTVFTNTSYHGGSEHVSYSVPASISFAFTGQSFWYFSDMNHDHGNCSILVDGVVVVASFSTYSPTRQYSTALYSQTVEPGSHAVTITNLVSNKGLGLDYFVYRPVSNDVPNSQDVTLMPCDSHISFAPAGSAWSHVDPNCYSETSQSGASFTFTFEGEYAWFHWTKDSNHGTFLVSVDGGTPSKFSAYSPTKTSDVILWSRAFEPGTHTLQFTNVEVDQRFGISNLSYRPISQPASQDTTIVATSPSTGGPSGATSAVSSQAGTGTSASASVSESATSISLSSSLTEASTSVTSSSFGGVTPQSDSSSQTTPSSTQIDKSPGSGGTVPPAVSAGAAVAGAICIIVVLGLIFIKIRRRRRARRAVSKTASDIVEEETVSVRSVARAADGEISLIGDEVYPWVHDTANPMLPDYSERPHRLLTQNRESKLHLLKH